MATEDSMAKWAISSKISGADMGVYEGETAEDAHRAMIIDAGYEPGSEDFYHWLSWADDLTITEIEGGLTAVDSIDGWSVRDEGDGVWWPYADAAAEIDASNDPAGAAVEMCETFPMRGAWHT